LCDVTTDPSPGEYKPYPGSTEDADCSFCAGAGVAFLPVPFKEGCGPEHWAHMQDYPWAIVDTVRMPPEMDAGEYVLQWRW
jgi:hypothetical protein